jgi:hypothetical protein
LNYFNYFSEIEETFVRRRGKNLFLSPLDWALMETWQEREIPLHIILRSIETVFDNHEKSKKKRTIKSLSFCSEEIEVQYEEWLENKVGKADDEVKEETESSIFSNKDIENYLNRIINELKNLDLDSEIKETINRVLPRLDELKTTFGDAENLENSLTDLEKIIDETLLKTADEAAKNEVKTQMISYQNKMEADVYQRTFDLMLLKKIRENLEIPRLSLFYL